MNTLIRYLYRDGANFKSAGSVVLPGALSPEDVQRVIEALDEDRYFVPGQVGLPDLQDSFAGCESYWDPDNDHVWHELLGVEPSDQSPSLGIDLSAEAWRDRMLAAEWNEGYEPPFKAVMDERWQEKVEQESESEPAP